MVHRMDRERKRSKHIMEFETQQYSHLKATEGGGNRFINLRTIDPTSPFTETTATTEGDPVMWETYDEDENVTGVERFDNSCEPSESDDNDDDDNDEHGDRRNIWE